MCESGSNSSKPGNETMDASKPALQTYSNSASQSAAASTVPPAGCGSGSSAMLLGTTCSPGGLLPSSGKCNRTGLSNGNASSSSGRLPGSCAGAVAPSHATSAGISSGSKRLGSLAGQVWGRGNSTANGSGGKTHNGTGSSKRLGSLTHGSSNSSSRPGVRLPGLPAVSSSISLPGPSLPVCREHSKMVLPILGELPSSSEHAGNLGLLGLEGQGLLPQQQMQQQLHQLQQNGHGAASTATAEPLVRTIAAITPAQQPQQQHFSFSAQDTLRSIGCSANTGPAAARGNLTGAGNGDDIAIGPARQLAAAALVAAAAPQEPAPPLRKSSASPAGPGLKRVHFNEFVQVFTLPPQGAELGAAQGLSTGERPAAAQSQQSGTTGQMGTNRARANGAVTKVALASAKATKPEATEGPRQSPLQKHKLQGDRYSAALYVQTGSVKWQRPKPSPGLKSQQQVQQKKQQNTKQQPQQQGEWVTADYVLDVVGWRKARRYKAAAKGASDSTATAAEPASGLDAPAAGDSAPAGGTPQKPPQQLQGDNAAASQETGTALDAGDSNVLPATAAAASQSPADKTRSDSAPARQLSVAAQAAAAVAAAARAAKAAGSSGANDGLCNSYKKIGDVWSPWHQSHRNKALPPAPIKGTAAAAEMEAMMAEEGLDAASSAAVMGHLYKLRRPPPVDVMRQRIQRFKAVIAPYRRPSMLSWVRKFPRILDNAEGTLRTTLAQLLQVLSPGIMLPDQALELIDKCPQLVGRTAEITKVKLDLFSDLLGAEQMVPMVVKFPAMLTMGKERITETLNMTHELLSGPGELSQLLRDRLTNSSAAAVLTAAATGVAVRQMHSIPAAGGQQNADAVAAAAVQASQVEQALPPVAITQVAASIVGQPIAQQRQLEAAAASEQQRQSLQQQQNLQQQRQQSKQQGVSDQQQQQQAMQQQGQLQGQQWQQLQQQQHEQQQCQQQQQDQGYGQHWLHVAQQQHQLQLGQRKQKQVQQQGHQQPEQEPQPQLLQLSNGQQQQAHEQPPHRAQQLVSQPRQHLQQHQQPLAHSGQQQEGTQQHRPFSGTITQMTRVLLLQYPAIFMFNPARVLEHFRKCEAIPEVMRLAGTTATSLLSPAVLPESQFQLFEHRAEFVKELNELGPGILYSLTIMGSRSFEARFPGFAAWREQHKAIPVAKTLDELEGPKDKRNSARSTAMGGSTGGNQQQGGTKRVKGGKTSKQQPPKRQREQRRPQRDSRGRFASMDGSNKQQRSQHKTVKHYVEEYDSDVTDTSAEDMEGWHTVGEFVRGYGMAGGAAEVTQQFWDAASDMVVD